jgi:hypothetical protein
MKLRKVALLAEAEFGCHGALEARHPRPPLVPQLRPVGPGAESLPACRPGPAGLPARVGDLGGGGACTDGGRPGRAPRPGEQADRHGPVRVTSARLPGRRFPRWQHGTAAAEVRPSLQVAGADCGKEGKEGVLTPGHPATKVRGMMAVLRSRKRTTNGWTNGNPVT